MSVILEGMRIVIHRLHEHGNRIVGILLYESTIRRALDRKEINARQYTILSQLLDKGPTDLEEVQHSPWYRSLYIKLNDKTRHRDLRQLREMELLFLDNTANRTSGPLIERGLHRVRSSAAARRGANCAMRPGLREVLRFTGAGAAGRSWRRGSVGESVALACGLPCKPHDSAVRERECLAAPVPFGYICAT